MQYYRLTEGLKDDGILIPSTSKVFDHISNQNKDWYLSTYKYNDEHYAIFKETNSIRGIVDVTGNKLWWDFDCEVEPEAARPSAVTLCERLIKYGIDKNDLMITFSGNKGYGVELKIKQELSPREIKNIAFQLSSDLDHFDVKVYNASRMLRVTGTKHQTTGLYKTPITFEQLKNLNTDGISALAKKIPSRTEEMRWEVVDLPEELYKAKEKESKAKVKALVDRKFDVSDIDFTHKVRGWTSCKWALANGYQIMQNDRHEKFLCIIAHAKSLNNTKEQAYQFAKEADRYGVSIYGGERALKEDIWRMVESVYADSWKGGTYSCKDGKYPWMTEICQSLGAYKCKHNEGESFVNVEKVFDEFFVYAKDIEKNTIKTGISDLDDRLRLVIGQMVGLLGAPSSGKTSIALDILENTSREGLLSVFYSLDMASSELFQKIAQRVTGYTDVQLFDYFKNDPNKSREIGEKVAQAYGNVKFCFDTGVSVDKIEADIEEFENRTNNKVKLLLLDYNELLSSPYSDATASSGYNAGAIKKLTNNKGLCTISLLQPPKVVGDASDEITSYRSIKGSSLLEQCFSVIIGIYRPGFSSENNSDDDRYMVMNVLKNRLGKLFSLNFCWDGAKGKITRAGDYERGEIKKIKDKKKQDKMVPGSLF